MDTLRELIGLGFSPAMALVVVAVIILWGSLCAVVVVVWKMITKRINDMNRHIEECDRERGELREDVATLKTRAERMDKCPRANCPLRLP